MALRGDEEVLRLHVAVHDPVRVQELEGQHRLGHVVLRRGCAWCMRARVRGEAGVGCGVGLGWL